MLTRRSLLTRLPAAPLIAAIAVTARGAKATGNGRAEWSLIPGAQLRSEYPSAAMLTERRCNGVIGPSAILAVWCGWAWDPENEVGYLLAHGGHTDYGGNEVYRWTFATGWERLSDPDYVDTVVFGGGKGLPSSPDGKTPLARPSATHTYASEFVLDGVPYLLASGNGWMGGSFTTCWKLKLADLSWAKVAPIPHNIAPPFGGALDPVTRKFIGLFGGYTFTTFDPTANVWAKADGTIYAMEHSAVVDPERRLFVVFRVYNGEHGLRVVSIGPSGMPSGPSRVINLGTAGGPNTNALAHDSVSKATLVLFGNRLLRFDGAAVTEIELPPVPTKSGTVPRNGIFNRLSYAKSVDGFVVPLNARETWLLRVGR